MFNMIAEAYSMGGLFGWGFVTCFAIIPACVAVLAICATIKEAFSL